MFINEKIKIMSIVPHLGGGGAEIHLVRVLNNLNAAEFDITLVTVRPNGPYLKYLDNKIKVVALTKGSIKSSTLNLLLAVPILRRLLKREQPDILWSLLTYVNLASIKAIERIKRKPLLVLSEQIRLGINEKENLPIVERYNIWRIGKRYNLADSIIAISEGVKNELLTLDPKINNKLQVIYNAGFDENIERLAKLPLKNVEKPTNGLLIVGCGRLTYQKAFENLIAAFTKVREEVPAHLWLIGEGPDREKLERTVSENDVSDYVSFLGFQENPYQYIAVSDVFVLSSRFEGFGNVIVEAMACGVPVIATDCPYGPAEIIENHVNGILVPVGDIAGLAKAIRNILHEKELNIKLVREGYKRSRSFSAERIAKTYAEHFRNLVKNRDN